MKKLIKMSSLLLATIMLVSLFATNAFALVWGDLTGDGKVSVEDAVYALYYVFFEDYPVNQSIDFDGNGKENANDAIYLLYNVYFGDVDYPLKNDEWTKKRY